MAISPSDLQAIMKEILREELRKRPQTTFTEYQGNPIIGPSGKSGDWREFGVAGPLVVLNPEDGRYYMFVTGWSGNRAWAPGYVMQIGLFTSEDGLNWTEHPNNPVIPKGPAGSWNEKGVHSAYGTVVWDRYANNWKLYFWGRDAADHDRIGVAESTDLINWTERPENPIISSRAEPAFYNTYGLGAFHRIGDPGLGVDRWIGIAQDAGRYVQLGNSQALEVYTSADGITWTWQREQRLAPDLGNIHIRNIYPQVVRDVFNAQRFFGLFVLLYEASDGHYRGQFYISALASYDGLHWWQIPRPIYHEIGYGQRSPFWQTIHPYLLLCKDGAFLYHAHSYSHKDGGFVEWIEVAFLDPVKLCDLFTSLGVVYIWDAESVSANTNGYMYVNALGYEFKEIYFQSNKSGDLTVEIDPDGTGNWYLLYQRTGITSDVTITDHAFTHLRMRFSTDATLTAKVVLKR